MTEAERLIDTYLGEVSTKFVGDTELKVAKKFGGTLHGATKDGAWFYFESKKDMESAGDALRREGYAVSSSKPVASGGETRKFVIQVS